MSAHWNRFLLLLSTITLWIIELNAKEVRIVCYYTNWSVYRPGDAKFNPQNINPYLCTHLVYAFGGFTKENTLKPFDKYQDIEKGGYAKFVGLKTYNKNLKTLLAIGGWNEGSTRFSPMVANADRRKELVKNTIKFLRQNHFDGLDLDWEYPSFRDGGKARDRDNYAQLVQELREEFDRESEKTGRPRLLLTMAVPAGIEYINKGYDIPKLNEYLDWMNILSYDYHSAYEPAVNHHSPLYPIEEENEYSLDIDLNIDYTIKHYVKMGADKSKLVLGIPTYGRSYTLYNPDANEIGAPADGPGEMGEATRENGYLAYYEICENLKSEDWVIEAPYPDAMGPYAYNNNQWVGYDDEEIAAKKAEYVAKNGLGGIMFWSIDNDDFRGKCGDRPYPIIEAAKEALLKAYGLTDANLLATTKKPIKNRTKTRGTTKSIESTTETAPSIRPRPNSRRKNINRVTKEGKPKRRPTNGRSKKKQQTTTLSSISSLVVTPSYTTPAPPSTPDGGGDFKCEDEGFFPHPKDCKKYFWCLSGPSDLGIVAHQFTCPAGLYFNKAAASCDYSQNVLCNKKLSKSTTTTTTTISPTSTTRKPPPKITAATSRTTVTTTEEPEIEDEYDEEYDEDVLSSAKDAEQDPRVIKELIELIKKAGGIEELEKQLNISDVGSGNGNLDATTRSTLNKSLYERVLGRATASLNEQKKTSFKTYNTIGRNSRGPQNEGLDNEKVQKSVENPKTRGRPQYTSIIRSRPSTEANEQEIKRPIEEDEQSEQDAISEPPTRLRSSPFRKSQPEYVTIRRQRITTTTEINEKDDKETEDKESYADDEENESKTRSTTSSPYVTIRRFRPTTEKAKDDASEDVEENITTSRYIELRSRGTTTSTESSSSYSPEISSSQSPIDENLNSVEENTVENTDEHNNITELNNVINKTDGLKDVVDNIKEIIKSQKEEDAEKLPVLADPRPFSLNNQKKQTIYTPSVTTTTKTTTQDILENQRLKVSVGINKNFNHQQQEDGNNDVLDDDKFPSKHRFSTETSNDDYQINKRIRGRGQSRFTGQTVATTIRTRPIIKVTEKPYNDYEIIEYNRKYRPDIAAEIADLSSLLAVDLKDLNSGRNSGRRRRPTTTTTTTSTSTTTSEPNEIEKTGSRTIPIARKLLNGAQFGRSNRFRSTTSTSTTTSTSKIGLVGDNKDEKVVIKKFGRPLFKNSNRFRKNFNISEETHQIQSTTIQSIINQSTTNRSIINQLATNQSIINESITNQSIINQLPTNQSIINESITNQSITSPSTTTTLRSLPTRRRIVLRKLIKPHTTSTTTSTTSTTSTTTTEPTTTIVTEKEILTSKETLVTENESIPTEAQTTINTNKGDDDKEKITLRNEILESKKISVEKEEGDDDKSEEADDNEEEGENIKLSESIVRESSQNFRNNLQEGVIFGKEKSFKSNNFDEKGKFTTELPYSIRTRKIIRKLTTTEVPSSPSTETETKFKKTFSRLKPTTGFGDEKLETSTISLLNKEPKRKYGFRRLSLPKKLGEEENEPEIKIKPDENQPDNFKPLKPTSFKPNRPLFRRRKIINQDRNEQKFVTSSQKPLQEDLRLNKSLYNRRIPTFTVYSTTTTTTDNYNLNQNEEESTISTEKNNEEGKDIINFDSTTEFEKETSISNNLKAMFEEDDLKETSTIDLKELKEIMSTASVLDDETTLSDDKTTMSDAKTTLSDDNTTLGDDKTTLSDDKTTLSDDKTTLSDDKTTLDDDKTTLSEDETTLSDDDAILNDDKTTISNDHHILDDLTTLSDDKTTLRNDETTLYDDKTSISDDKTSILDDKTSIIDDKTTISDDKTTISDDKTTISDDEVTLSDNKSTLNDEETTLSTKIKESLESDHTTEGILKTTLKPKVVTSSINHPSTRYGEKSNLTLFSRVGRLYLKNKPYGGINNLLGGDKTSQSSTTESPLSKLLHRKKELERLSSTTEKEEIVENEDEKVQFENDFNEVTTENDEITTNQGDLITTVNDLVTTTALDDSSSIETSTEFVSTTTTTRKPSRLFRPIALRPKFTGRLKSDLSSTSTTSSPFTSERIKANRFNKYKPTPRRFYSSSTTENQDVIIDESDEYVDELDDEEKDKQKPSLFSRPGYKPSYIILKPSEKEDEYESDENVSSQKPSTRTYKKFTTSTAIPQNLPDININITAVNQRNRNLFNKTRKMNTPFPNIQLRNETNITNSIEQSLLTSTKQDEITEKITSSTSTTTTEKVTTLHHIFAETENLNEMTTKGYPQQFDEKKIEKIVEINRIVKVTSKVKNGTDEKIDGDDKVDKSRLLVSRVVEIKVVESENGTNTTRQDKKYETNQKNDFDIPISNGQNGIQVNQIRIDSVSSSKKITPKPFYSVETATIPLEGLFQTNHPPEEKIDLQNELLEGENSNYVNVRVLQQDANQLGDRRKVANAKFIPVRILKDNEDEEVKADVIEVTPSESNQQIRIVPISVSIQQTN